MSYLRKKIPFDEFARKQILRSRTRSLRKYQLGVRVPFSRTILPELQYFTDQF